MRREIKFRVWDSFAKKMRRSEDVGIELLADDFRELAKNGHKINVNNFLSYGIAVGFQFLQYTGLKDKDGKEIYEGDILDWYGREKYEVIWKNCGFQTKWDMGNGLFDIEPLGYVEDMSVIGNVFENPFLIG